MSEEPDPNPAPETPEETRLRLKALAEKEDARLRAEYLRRMGAAPVPGT